MVYELRCYTLKPGKMPEYLKAAETIGRPARGQNYGVNHGYWTAEFGALNQIWHLWKYDSYEERTRLRGELAKHKPWTEGYVPVIRPLIERQDLRLMNAVVDIKPSDNTTGNIYELRIYRCNM
ncbi:MAG: NIPSNAP family protein, partial [Reyranella sp.]|nr:NIPSNAP family protein [Reyranella sp.]